MGRCGQKNETCIVPENLFPLASISYQIPLVAMTQLTSHFWKLVRNLQVIFKVTTIPCSTEDGVDVNLSTMESLLQLCAWGSSWVGG